MRKELVQICNDIIKDEQQQGIEDQLTSVQMLYEKLLVLNYLTSRKSAPLKTEKAEQPESKAVEPQTIPDVRESEPEKPLMEEKPETSAKPVAREPKPAPEPPREEKAPPAQPKHKPQESYKTPEFVEAKEEPQPKQPASPPRKAPPQSTNESPVEFRELADDNTPEQTRSNYEKQASAVKSSSINDRYGTGVIKLGLNDRIAFMNNLFDGSQEDLNRVLSQINTFDSYSEAETFIEQMVKPDYNWADKEDFEMRFMDRVKQRFGEG